MTTEYILDALRLDFADSPGSAIIQVREKVDGPVISVRSPATICQGPIASPDVTVKGRPASWVGVICYCDRLRYESGTTARVTLTTNETIGANAMQVDFH
jgi:hypothetical protein